MEEKLFVKKYSEYFKRAPDKSRQVINDGRELIPIDISEKSIVRAIFDEVREVRLLLIEMKNQLENNSSGNCDK